MSNLKQKDITTVDASTPLSLSYLNMGEIYVDSSSDGTLTVPDADGVQGLWFTIINGDYITLIQDVGITEIITLYANENITIISNGTDWIVR